MNSSSTNRAVGVADTAGVLGAVFAALCCAGLPFIVTGLAALGLSSLRRDSILWPLMIVSLLVALWGFWIGRRMHGSVAPLLIAALSGVALIAGVIFVHGMPARVLIGVGALGLIAATVWNITLRARLAREIRT